MHRQGKRYSFVEKWRREPQKPALQVLCHNAFTHKIMYTD